MSLFGKLEAESVKISNTAKHPFKISVSKTIISNFQNYIIIYLILYQVVDYEHFFNFSNYISIFAPICDKMYVVKLYFT